MVYQMFMTIKYKQQPIECFMSTIHRKKGGWKSGKFLSGNKVMWNCLKTEFHAKNEKIAENDLVEEYKIGKFLSGNKVM